MTKEQWQAAHDAFFNTWTDEYDNRTECLEKAIAAYESVNTTEVEDAL